MRQLPLFLCVAALVVGCDTMEEKYQRDMDRVPITHVDYLASLTTEYFEKAGRMPLADRLQGKAIEVFVTHRSLDPSYTEQAARLPIVLLSTNDLKADLERVLGRTINLPSDPQNYASFAPTFYIYEVNAARACVAGHLFSEAPGTRLIEGNAPGASGGNKYYKYEHCIPNKAA